MHSHCYFVIQMYDFLFLYMTSNVETSYHKKSLHLLFFQHEQIMRFPSRQFYDRKLICDVSVRTRPRIRNDPFGSYHSRAIFWNVKGTEGVQHFKTTDNGDQSKFNNAQAKAVVSLLAVCLVALRFCLCKIHMTQSALDKIGTGTLLILSYVTRG